MATLKQKFEALLELQIRIEDQEKKMQQELDKLKKEKSAMIKEFNTPIIHSIVESISTFLTKEMEETGEESLDIRDIDICINTGEYDDLNMGGAEGEIVHVIQELKFDEDGQVIVGFQHYCGGNDWGSHDEIITSRLSILRRIANYLSNNYGMPLSVSTSSLVFSGDSDYYQNRLDETDNRCDEFGLITIDESVTEILPNEYEDCDGFWTLTIPKGVVKIGKEAFKNCGDIETVILPESLKSIEDGAFEFCSSLRKIIFPKGLLSIGANAFNNCESLKCINLPDGLESIGENAFRGVVPCYVSFGKIRLDAAVIGLNDQTILIDRSTGQTFDERIFQRLKGLSFFALPDDVTSIEEWAFATFDWLTEIHIPDSVTSIGEKAFLDCKGLTEIHIPDSVTSIGEQAFSGCEGLTEIHIPDSVTSIGEQAFSYCWELTRVSVSPGNEAFDSRNDCNAIIESRTNKLIAGCKNTVIPDSVTSIGQLAFEGCSGLTKIHIPDSVTFIGDYAFSDCEGLTEIHIPDSVTSIGEQAFSYCRELTRISIPKGLDISNAGLGNDVEIIER